MGRPSKFTDEVREQILRGVEVGVFPEVAARRAGISPASFYRWKRGSSPEQVKFRNNLGQALATYEVRLSATLTQATANNGRLTREVLGYRFASRWRAQRGAVEDPLTRPVGLGSDADEHVVIDPTMIEEIVTRLLDAGRQRSGGSELDVSHFERFIDPSDADGDVYEASAADSEGDPDEVRKDLP